MPAKGWVKKQDVAQPRMNEAQDGPRRSDGVVLVPSRRSLMLRQDNTAASQEKAAFKVKGAYHPRPEAELDTLLYLDCLQ